MKTKKSNTPRFKYKVWLSNGYFISVDDKGYVNDSDCLEGALGCVIKVRSPMGKDQYQVRALKVPRLLADTQRENAFICTLLEKEFTIVRQVLGQGGSKPGLVGATCGFLPDLRKKNGDMTEFVNYDQDASKTSDCFVFATFEKGRTPCFANVRLQSGVVESHPEIEELKRT